VSIHANIPRRISSANNDFVNGCAVAPFLTFSFILFSFLVVNAFIAPQHACFALAFYFHFFAGRLSANSTNAPIRRERRLGRLSS
jgi:hypothetical protein